MNPTVITLCFLAFAIIMFVLEKIPLGLTATIVSVGLCVTGVLEPKQAFAGYVDSNVILCVAMFVVGQALFETGMANKIGGLVTKFAQIGDVSSSSPSWSSPVLCRVPVQHGQRGRTHFLW